MDIIDFGKYVVFKRSDFERTLTQDLITRYKELELPDAVVIRRQDKFASPCLLTYAAMISMVAESCPDKIQQAELQAIADYFHEMGVLAGDEGYKLPTL